MPVAIYNNTKDDEDAATRERFEEPSWNNPVVRVVDAEGKDVVGRHAGDYTTSGLLRAMREALEARKTDVPAWFDLLQREAASRKRGVEQAVFGMT